MVSPAALSRETGWHSPCGGGRGRACNPAWCRLTPLPSCRLCQGAPGTAAGEGRADRRPHAALLCLLPQPSQGVLPARQVRAAPPGPAGPSSLPRLCLSCQAVTPSLSTAKSSAQSRHALPPQADSGLGDVGGGGGRKGMRGVGGWLGIELQESRGHSG